MRILRVALWTCCAGVSLFAQSHAAPNAVTRYYVVFLRPDPARRSLAKADGERLQAAHMANIHKMAADGVLMSAGPFDDSPTTISGIFVFKVDSLESAKAIAAADPTVYEHRNTVDLHAWDGPAGIGDGYFRLHRMDPSTPENMRVRPLCILYRGPAWETKAAERDSLLQAHERYIDQLKAQGKLGAAGGIQARDDLLGLIIFKPIPFEKPQQLLNNDPAVEAGMLRAEFHHWWSSDHVLPW
jgi:uncharacterized protein YciI